MGCSINHSDIIITIIILSCLHQEPEIFSLAVKNGMVNSESQTAFEATQISRKQYGTGIMSRDPRERQPSLSVNASPSDMNLSQMLCSLCLLFYKCLSLLRTRTQGLFHGLGYMTEIIPALMDLAWGEMDNKQPNAC